MSGDHIKNAKLYPLLETTTSTTSRSGHRAYGSNESEQCEMYRVKNTQRLSATYHRGRHRRHRIAFGGSPPATTENDAGGNAFDLVQMGRGDIEI